MQKNLKSPNNFEDLQWTIDWFAQYCDSYWEHDNQIKIQTVSNPGWHVIIDVADTPLEAQKTISYKDNTQEDDWLFYNLENNKFEASGDLTKLPAIFKAFRKIASTA